jgi:hypothetical protein
MTGYAAFGPVRNSAFSVIVMLPLSSLLLFSNKNKKMINKTKAITTIRVRLFLRPFLAIIYESQDGKIQ